MRQKLCAVGCLLLTLTACAGTDVLNALVPSDGYTVTNDIAYDDGPRQMLDVYQPAQPDARHSVVLFFYGGSWKFGSKDQYLFFAEALTERGYTVVVADYRLYPEVYFPGFLDDSAAALVWTHDHIADYGGDPARIFVAGHSAGAYNAMMLAVNDSYLNRAGGRPDWVHGVIGISGPYNFLPLTDPKLIDMFQTERKPDQALQTQPYTFALHKIQPTLLVTGTDDDTVNWRKNTVAIAERLKAQGTDITTRYYEDTGHIGTILSAARGFRGKTPLLQDISAFIDAR